MYEIHFRRNYDSQKDYVKVGEAKSLEEARELRWCSGDLVVHAKTHKIVKDTSWLWDWELAKPDCYSRLAIKCGV